ncbi:MAG TPA: carboxypeptidase-like regulatory domain-containing protein, partial [Gemmatimonadaceae bacterium]|nr:carboxypeptidase-like regulatory domain-containing protein [Gemmatimonadaceae bacterium]
MMRARLAGIGLALGIATAAGAQNPAQPPLAPATMVGVVRDSTGAPIADAEVVIRELTQGTRTNARGEFTLRDIPVGAYQVWFRRLGYRSVDYNWEARP